MHSRPENDELLTSLFSSHFYSNAKVCLIHIANSLVSQDSSLVNSHSCIHLHELISLTIDSCFLFMFHFEYLFSLFLWPAIHKIFIRHSYQYMGTWGKGVTPPTGGGEKHKLTPPILTPPPSPRHSLRISKANFNYVYACRAILNWIFLCVVY